MFREAKIPYGVAVEEHGWDSVVGIPRKVDGITWHAEYIAEKRLQADRFTPWPFQHKLVALQGHSISGFNLFTNVASHILRQLRARERERINGLVESEFCAAEPFGESRPGSGRGGVE